mmetsp:Transcript_9436/g.38217  ORF Transcript_9436/g.38217 Transcript_9436/m.38217 type:complete len:322 (-) Transcript_9436:3991-4956(-)
MRQSSSTRKRSSGTPSLFGGGSRRLRSSDPARRKDRHKAANFVCGSLFAAGSALIARSLTMFDDDDQYALFLSLLAGLATSVGGIIAVMKKPDQKLLAFLLGTAIGVMATLSAVELYVKNLMQNGFVEVTVAMCIGAVVYVVLEPLLPKTEALEAKVEKQGSGGDDVPTRMSKARLMRLGILMAITMTLHNLPEGFAVAFSSFTGIGPVMAAAIGVHNIPEGIIVAAPVYAATGSRRYALMLATASGLSEPVGAFIALFFIKPYLTPKLLHYLLAGTGGMMTAVCIIELFPEGRKCKHDGQLLKGIVFGSVLMLSTLYVGV